MADIVAADVTNIVLSRRRVGFGAGGTTIVDVDCDITIDPGTTDAYPTGGIPLTTLFTLANGQNIDTGIDTTQPIMEIAKGVARISSGVTVTNRAFFYNGGSTPATQTLVLQRAATLPSLTATDITIVSATSITSGASAFVTSGFKVGDQISMDGWTGTAGNNGQVCRITAVAAGTLTIAASGLTADASGESVTIQTIYRPENALAEHSNTDVTLAGDFPGSDTTFKYRTTLRGVLRHDARAYRIDQ